MEDNEAVGTTRGGMQQSNQGRVCEEWVSSGWHDERGWLTTQGKHAADNGTRGRGGNMRQWAAGNAMWLVDKWHNKRGGGKRTLCKVMGWWIKQWEARVDDGGQLDKARVNNSWQPDSEQHDKRRGVEDPTRWSTTRQEEGSREPNAAADDTTINCGRMRVAKMTFNFAIACIIPCAIFDDPCSVVEWLLHHTLLLLLSASMCHLLLPHYLCRSPLCCWLVVVLHAAAPPLYFCCCLIPICNHCWSPLSCCCCCRCCHHCRCHCHHHCSHSCRSHCRRHFLVTLVSLMLSVHHCWHPLAVVTIALSIPVALPSL